MAGSPPKPSEAGSVGRRRGKEVERSFRRKAETERNGFRPDAAQANQVPQGVLQLLG